jgi:hypothetical protein
MDGHELSKEAQVWRTKIESWGKKSFRRGFWIRIFVRVVELVWAFVLIRHHTMTILSFSIHVISRLVDAMHFALGLKRISRPYGRLCLMNRI